jgi:hypothetical protein
VRAQLSDSVHRGFDLGLIAVHPSMHPVHGDRGVARPINRVKAGERHGTFITGKIEQLASRLSSSTVTSQSRPERLIHV